MRCLELPFAFSPERLRADLSRVEPADWIPHQQRRQYEGEWSGAALRSPGGSAHSLVPDALGGGEFRDTPLLSRCAYFQDVLGAFQCPLQAVRLLRLHAGSHIAEHVDHALDFDDGEVRIHIPIVTTDDVKFYLDGHRLVMAPGECWYTNVNLPHSVENHGTVDRIHLVIDCVVDAWLRDVFATAPRPPCDYYAAILQLPAAPAAGALLDVFARFAAPRIRFRAERTTLVLNWNQTRSWQIRLRLPADAGSRAWIAQLESSPDPDGEHRDEYRTLLDRFLNAFPSLSIVSQGLG